MVRDFTARVLGDARYSQRHPFPKWNILPTVLQEPRLFPRVFPELTREDHLRLAKAFEDKAEKVSAQHHRALERGRKAYGTHGALISGGFREDWPENSKEVIRRLAHGSTLLAQAATAHTRAAKLRNVERDPGTSNRLSEKDLEVLHEVAKPRIRRRLYASHGPVLASLARRKLVRLTREHPGHSSFSDYYALTVHGRRALRDQRRAVAALRERYRRAAGRDTSRDPSRRARTKAKTVRADGTTLTIVEQVSPSWVVGRNTHGHYVVTHKNPYTKRWDGLEWFKDRSSASRALTRRSSKGQS